MSLKVYVVNFDKNKSSFIFILVIKWHSIKNYSKKIPLYYIYTLNEVHPKSYRANNKRKLYNEYVFLKTFKHAVP